MLPACVAINDAYPAFLPSSGRDNAEHSISGPQRSRGPNGQPPEISQLENASTTAIGSRPPNRALQARRYREYLSSLSGENADLFKILIVK
jgi:hypothetical protein